jgi:hypothetical protein
VADPIDDADRVLLERLAARIVELRMETPAILTLETAQPLSLLASQAMAFFEPLVQSLFRLPDYRRFAALAERRDAIELLERLIEQAVEGRDRPAGATGAGPR